MQIARSFHWGMTADFSTLESSATRAKCPQCNFRHVIIADALAMVAYAYHVHVLSQIRSIEMGVRMKVRACHSREHTCSSIPVGVRTNSMGAIIYLSRTNKSKLSNLAAELPPAVLFLQMVEWLVPLRTSLADCYRLFRILG